MRSFTNKLTLSFLLLALWATGDVFAQKTDSSYARPPRYEKIDDYYMTVQRARQLAQDSSVIVIIVNMDLAYNSPDAYNILLQSGKIVMLNIQGSTIDFFNSRPGHSDNRNYQFVYNVSDSFRLYGPDGKSIDFQGPANPYMNLTNIAPPVSGKIYNLDHAERVAKVCTTHNANLFYDNMWDNFPDAGGKAVDYDRDKKADAWQPFWREGTITLMRNTRRLMGERLIIVNGDYLPDSLANGVLIEDFPGRFRQLTPLQALRLFQDWLRRGRAPHLCLAHSYAETERDALFATCLTLLVGERVAISVNEFPSLKVPIGKPTFHGNDWVEQDGLLVRAYQNGLVLVNVADTTVTVNLNRQYLTHDGKLVNSITLANNTGEILLIPVDPTAVHNPKPNAIPTQFKLEQNYPNPFNPTTMIQFDLPKSLPVTFTVYNILGQKMFEKSLGVLAAGKVQVMWNGTDAVGRELPSGIYFYQINAGAFTGLKRMTLLR